MLARVNTQPLFGLQTIAHRGAQIFEENGRFDIYLENTLPAFEKAAQMGMDAVELDVILTKDGQLAVHHDDATGRVMAMPKDALVNKTPWAVLQQAGFDFQRFLQKTFIQKDTNLEKFPLDTATLAQEQEDVRIPLLSEVIERTQTIKPDMHFYIEIKALGDSHEPGVYSPKIIDKLVTFIQKNNLHKNVTVISFNPWAVKLIKEKDPNIRTGLDYTGKEPLGFKGEKPLGYIGKLPSFIPAELMTFLRKTLQVDVFIPPMAEVTQKMVQQCHKAGLKIAPWVWHETREQEIEQMKRLKTLGVDGLITNNPDALLGIVA